MSEVRFTTDQQDAIDVSKRHLDACVVAGPGSGKTTVLVEYFRRLVAEANVDPLRILAITFTEKAAGNMRKKLAEAFHESPEKRARLERAWVSTVHGFCARLLRENAVFAGVDPEFYVADERESWRLQQEAMAAAMEALFAERRPAVRALIRGLSSMDFEQAVLNAYDAMRGAGVTVEELAAFPTPAGQSVTGIGETLHAIRAESLSLWSYAQKEYLAAALEAADRIVNAATPLEGLRAIQAFSCNLNKCKRNTPAYELVRDLRDQIEDARYTLLTEYYSAQRELLIEILRRFDAAYRERKRQAGALDFADLEEFTVRLMQDHPETRARVQAQFDHILMDEFQDTNGQQAKLLEMVRRPDRFYAVGDINQSIFGFRHAEPEGFAEYQSQIAASGRHLVNLVDNFRSRAAILSAVETVLNNEPGIVPRGLVAGRTFEEDRPRCVDVIAAPEPSMEAQWVARRILELQPEFEFEDVAVLIRNTEVIPEITEAFETAGIPYLVNRGRGFYESREVNDLTHLLRVVANPRDEISMATVLRSPLAEVSDEALLRLKALDKNLGAALLRLRASDAPDFGPDYEKLRRFHRRLAEWRTRREYITFDRLLLAAIDDCGYPASPNLDKFLAQARDAAAHMSLDEFVEELSLVRAANPREPDAPPEDSIDAVKIMTVHSAKGLEFPVVFVAGMQKGVETNPPVVAFSRRHGLGARWRDPAVREEKDDLFQHALRQEWKRREAEESSRLLYVAMTRAEQHLFLSFSGKPAEWARTVCEKLALDPSQPGEQRMTRTAPDGKEWALRILVAEGPPEGPAPIVEKAEAAQTAAEFVAAPEVSDQHDTNATVTAISRFAHCPREYFLGHYLGFEGRVRNPEGGAALSASEFGSQIHALLAGTPVPDPDPEAVRLAEVFRSGPLGRRLPKAKRIEREFDFLMAVEDLVIRGQVDLWFEEGADLAIVDYKTDSVTGPEAHRRAQEYALQLRLYAMAVEQVAGRAPNRAWLHFLRPNTLVEVDLRPSLLDSPEQIVRDFQEAQSRLEFPLVEGDHCHRCPFHRDLCPAGTADGATLTSSFRPGPA